MIQKTSVIGLGKLGACMAGCFAAKGFPTIGVDVSAEAVAAVNAGKPPVDETDLAETIRAGAQRLTATQSYADAVLGSDATFVIVPTPSEPNGAFSLRYAREAFRSIGQALAKKSGYHLVIMTSTVLPGGTEYGLIPILEKESGKRCGEDFGVCYSPEFIALGSVIRDFLHPDFVLIGESDDRAGAMLADFYGRVCNNHPPVARMNIVNAELTKVSVNSFMTMKISFANMIANLCEELPGGNVDVVTGALSLFGGVGQKALRGGLGYGGPCLPRDNVALSYLSRSLGHEVSLPAAVDTFNRSLVPRLADAVVRHTRQGGAVTVLGLSYKPHTWVVEESQGLQLAAKLLASGLHVTVFDPKALQAARRSLPAQTRFANSLEEAIRDADTIVVTTPDPAFAQLPQQLQSAQKKPVVIDVWRFLQETTPSGATYVRAGVGVAGPRLEERLRALNE
jgi:UDPglucose 6-dehydrogenase